MDVIAGEDGVVTRCGHLFCLSDFSSWTQEHSSCPSCNQEIEDVQDYLSLTQLRLEVHALVRKKERKDARSAAVLAPIPLKTNSLKLSGFGTLKRKTVDGVLPSAKREKAAQAAPQCAEADVKPDMKGGAVKPDEKAGREGRTFIQSTKIKALVSAVKEMIADGDDKALVFSQWTRMLDLVEVPLAENGIKVARLDGSMDAVTRASAIDKFKKRTDVRLFLISLKAGGVGLVC